MRAIPIPKALTILVLLACSACQGPQSSFVATGVEAERTLVLFWLMTISGGVILLAVMALTAMALYNPASVRPWLAKDRFIFATGIIFPIAALSVLLVYGLFILGTGPGVAASDSADEEPSMRIAISGEQWWWRVTYFDAAGSRIESANELHVPVGRAVQLELTSPDVIHSLWAPQLAGKLDMIPGRTTVLTVKATKEGVSRGQCAEFCGGAHALMSFFVVAHPAGEFETWLEAEAQPAQEPVSRDEREGQRLFLQYGCGACHAISGTEARGRVGPDLSHVGSRRSLGAATLPNSAEAFSAWIANHKAIKPDNKMPPYDVFSEEELGQLAHYLESLK